MLPSINKKLIVFLSSIFVLSLFLIYGSFLNIKSNYNQSNQAVINHQNKSVLLFGMQRAARERLFILYKMSLVTDVFELDELNISLAEQAGIFLKYRNDYQDLSLSNEELTLLKQQIEATKVGAGYMSNISSLLLDHKPKKAYQLLTQKAEPAQAHVLEIINLQIKIHRKELIHFIHEEVNDS